MIRSYPDTDLLWDTDTGKWFRPVRKKEVIQEKVQEVILEEKKTDYSRMSWKQFIFDEYKRCRKFPGWETIFNLHDAEDQQYFQMLDKDFRGKI